MAKYYARLMRPPLLRRLSVVPEECPNTSPVVSDVKVSTPFGHLAVKVWGDPRQPVVVCVHGFMENAASFDTLIPHLPSHLCYAAVDLPGHGLSSHIQQGFVYSDACYSQTLERLRRYFGVERVGIIGHSMGAGISMLYTHAYQKRTDFFVALDFVGYPQNYMGERLSHLSRRIDKIIGQEGLNAKERPRPWDTLLSGMVKAWGGSISRETAETLLTRSCTQVDELYKFNRDFKIQNNQIIGVTHDIPFLPDPDMSVCLLEAVRGVRFGSAASRKWNLEQYVRNHRYVEHHMLSGRHHFYIDKPHVAGHLISEFLRKHYHLKKVHSS